MIVFADNDAISPKYATEFFVVLVGKNRIQAGMAIKSRDRGLSFCQVPHTTTYYLANLATAVAPFLNE